MPQLPPLLHLVHALICMPTAYSIPRLIRQLPYKTPPTRKHYYRTLSHYTALQLMLPAASEHIRLLSLLSKIAMVHLRMAMTLQCLHCFCLALLKAMTCITKPNTITPITTCQGKIASSTGTPKVPAFPFFLLKSRNRLLTSAETFPNGRVYPSNISTALSTVIVQVI